MKKPVKPTTARPTTTARVYQDTHAALWDYAGRQRPRPHIQDLIESAVTEYLASLKKRSA